MTPEEMNPDSLSDRELRTDGIVDAAGRADELMDLDVFDPNGARVGRVIKCFVEGGRLVSCDVSIDGTLKRELQADADVARIETEWIADVDEGGKRVRITKAAAQFVPGARPLGEAFRDEPGGSSTFPRKNR